MASDTKDNASSGTVGIFLCGDVMPGRGIDRILPFPSDPEIHEPYVIATREHPAEIPPHPPFFRPPADPGNPPRNDTARLRLALILHTGLK